MKVKIKKDEQHGDRGKGTSEKINAHVWVEEREYNRKIE